MAYAALSDVQARVPRQIMGGAIGPGSQPSQAQVEQWLDEETAWVDAGLRWKYQTPITDTDDVALLKPLVADLVTARLYEMIAGEADSYSEAAARIHKRALQKLAYNATTGRIHLVLPNSTLADDGEAAVGQPSSTFTDPEVRGNNPRLFKVDMKF